jgi:hypothetical protein
MSNRSLTPFSQSWGRLSCRSQLPHGTSYGFVNLNRQGLQVIALAQAVAVEQRFPMFAVAIAFASLPLAAILVSFVVGFAAGFTV